MLLDDPLSAVDSHVGDHLFRKAISGPITQGVTRILVTHASHVLPKCDAVIVMKNGQIQHYGTHADLVAQGVDFTGAIDVSKSTNAETATTSTTTTPVALEAEISDENNDDDVNNDSNKANEGQEQPDVEDSTAKDNNKSETAAADDDNTGPANKTQHETRMIEQGKKLVEDEEKEEGKVAGSA